MLAHIRESDKLGQDLIEHCRNVATLCREADAAFSMPSLSYLTGLLHDMGKATSEFQNYLHWAVSHPGEKKNHQNHAASGAIYAWERWGAQDALTAQIVALCINGHHTGLQDCLIKSGESPFVENMQQDKRNLNYEEAKQYFEEQIAKPNELDALFAHASEEITEWITQRKMQGFDLGLLTKMLFSILIDADRWDSACFEYDVDPLEEKQIPDWKSMLSAFDDYRNSTFCGTTELDMIREEISDRCAAKAEGEQQVFTLQVPTGGGKTYASLRFALMHADKHHLKRIFYIIPYNTILDQNAADIQAALGKSADVLVHHGNVVKEDEEEDRVYHSLAERWDSKIILSSLVQFLNALYLGKNGSTRRMRQLTEAVIIFDEVQSIPTHCKGLFEKSVDFLTKHFGCTVVLCTATQPKIELKQEKRELMEDVGALYKSLKRVQYIPQLKPEMSNAEAAAKLAGIIDNGQSVLCVVNTKHTAWDVYEKATALIRENGWNILELPDRITEETLREKAEKCGQHDILCVHLSTLMCPAHRMERVMAVKIWTKQRKPVLCVSTALIEAGINVSFPVVVRSLAGLPSVIQAGGRCNRNCEYNCGDVYIWNLYEEKSALKKLPDVQNGRAILGSMLDSSKYRDDPDLLGMPEAVEEYFNREARYTNENKRYPYKEWNTDLVSMLSTNIPCTQSARSRADKAPAQLRLKQSFRTAGAAFRVIAEDTTGVMVPYGEGKELIAQLGSGGNMKAMSALLRKAQAYTVNLYPNVLARLTQEQALVSIGNTGVLALKDGWYERNSGVKTTKQELEDCIF